MKNNFQKILLLVSGISFLLFSFAFVFSYQKINEHNQKRQQDEVILQTETYRRDNIKALNIALQKIAPERALLENHFIKSSDIVPFLNIIEKLAREVGVSAQIDSVNAKIDNTELTVDLRATGRFETIYKFLTLLENSPYELDFLFMDIHKLSLSDSSGKNIKDSNWEAVFKIQLLSFIP